MFCPICCRSVNHLIKIVDGIKIYECSSCSVALINKRKKSYKKLYTFDSYQTQEKILRKRFMYLGRIISSFVQQGKLLDVGAGFGLFSSIINKLGKFQVWLIDSQIKPRYDLDKKVLYKMNYEDFVAGHPKGVWNLILMIDIMEHFRNPQEILEKTKKILSKNGYLVIQTPNYKSLMARICKNWSWWMVEDHKLLFSIKSIKLIIKKAGYEIVYFKTYEDFYDFKKNLDGNFSNKFIKGFFYLLFFPFYFMLRPILWYFGYGGAIFLIAKQYNRK